MTKVVWGARIRLAAVVMMALAATSCGDLVPGRGSSYLIMDALRGSSGADPATFSETVSSDVITVVDGVPTVFEDPGQVTLRLAMKDAGSPNPSAPSAANHITVNRYRVRYFRTDGRNVEGVDVPHAFDGAITGTISGSSTLTFTLVRIQAKREAPLAALAANGNVISAIAEVTFYGRDQTGREASVSGQLTITFANWGDPG